MTKYSKVKITIILPAYNEEKTIEKAILLFHKELPSADIYVINNNSSDKTHDIASITITKLKKNKTLKKGMIINESRQGKGNALRRAFLEIDSDIYLLADADLTYPAQEVFKLLDPILNNEADMVVGNRHAKGAYLAQNKRAFHNLGNSLVKNLVNYLFKANLSDIMSGYRALNKNFIKNYPIMVEGFEIETEMTIHALEKRFSIKEVPITYKNRPAGSFSKLNTFTDGLKVLKTIFNILRHFRPMLFFGFISLFFFLLSLITALPVINEWLNFHFINHIPLAILATGLGIAGLITLAIALVLDSISHQNRISFELNLIANKK
jgi:glycosyltransferase involved in cell wall biosynthesis